MTRSKMTKGRRAELLELVHRIAVVLVLAVAVAYLIDPDSWERMQAADPSAAAAASAAAAIGASGSTRQNAPGATIADPLVR